MNAVVISHYSEDLQWVKQIDQSIKVFVYSKTNKDFNYYPINKGNEVNLYLKYIIDNYNNLPDKILFLHGHSNSYHQDHDSVFICNKVNWNCNNYFSVNRRDYYQEVSPFFNARQYGWVKDNWNQIFSNYLQLPEKIFHYACSQFVVDKSHILQYEKKFYENLLNWINLTPLDNAISGRIFEYTWHYIFTKNNIENKYNDVKIFINV